MLSAQHRRRRCTRSRRRSSSRTAAPETQRRCWPQKTRPSQSLPQSSAAPCARHRECRGGRHPLGGQCSGRAPLRSCRTTRRSSRCVGSRPAALLIRGPPGTGKTRSAALLIASAQRLRGWSSDGAAAAAPPRVLAVAHNNGAADVLLQALLRMGVRGCSGRPAAVAPSVRHRTVTALAEQHPEVKELRAQARNASLAPHARSAASWRLRQRHEEVCQLMLGGAGVVVASCVGAHQLVGGRRRLPAGGARRRLASDGARARHCAGGGARVAARHRRRHATAATDGHRRRRAAPLARPLADGAPRGAGRRAAHADVQYRMPPALLEHPSRHARLARPMRRDGRAAPTSVGLPVAVGLPLCFVHCGGGDLDLEVSHPWAATTPAQLVARIVSILEAGDVRRFNVAVIAP